MDSDEKEVCNFLKRLDLLAKKFSNKEKLKSKTPDFRVYKTNKLAFYSEVKTVSPDWWLNNQLKNAPPGIIVGGGRKDPVFNRLSNKIHEAVQQFDAVNPSLEYPNVLAFINHDNTIDTSYRLNILTGDFFAEDGTRYPIYRKFSEGRIKNEKIRIHLYIWIDRFKNNFYFLNTINQEHLINLCKYLKIDCKVFNNLKKHLIMMKIPNY